MSNLCLIGLPEVGYIAGIAVISRGQKILWILTIVVLNWIGLLLYYYTYYIKKN